MSVEYAITAAGLCSMVLVGLWFWRRAKPEDDASIVARQLTDARVNERIHRAATEHHKALADMYAARAKRLGKVKA